MQIAVLLLSGMPISGLVLIRLEGDFGSSVGL